MVFVSFNTPLYKRCFCSPKRNISSGILCLIIFNKLKSDNKICDDSCKANPTATSKVLSFKLEPIVTVLLSVKLIPLLANFTGIFFPVTILTKLLIARL